MDTAVRRAMKQLAAVIPFFLAPSLALGLRSQESQGPLVGAPTALSVDAVGVAPLDPERILFRGPGVSGAPPAEVAPLDMQAPDFLALSARFVAAGVDLDAMSLGLDWINADAAGRAVLGKNRWAALSFAVGRGTSGTPGGAIFGEFVGNGVAGDLFTYVIDGSNDGCVPVPFNDRTVRSHDGGEIRFAADAAIDAHDLNMALMRTDLPLRMSLPVTLPPPAPAYRFYFSLTRATASAPAAAGWWGGSAPSGASVLSIDWRFDSLSGTGRWVGDPVVEIDPAQLGLGVGDELDALSVDATRGHLLFSTRGGTDQFLYSPLPPVGGAGVTAYKILSGVTISDRVGLTVGDEVNALCAIDPGAGSAVAFGFGRPRALQAVPPAPYQLSAGAFRHSSSLGQDLITTVCVGWPGGGALPGNAVCYVSADPFVFPLQLALFGSLPRNWQMPSFQGDPQQLSLQVPQQLTGSGFDVWFHWGAFDLQQQFDLAPPVSLQL